MDPYLILSSWALLSRRFSKTEYNSDKHARIPTWEATPNLGMTDRRLRFYHANIYTTSLFCGGNEGLSENLHLFRIYRSPDGTEIVSYHCVHPIMMHWLICNMTYLVHLLDQVI